MFLKHPKGHGHDSHLKTILKKAYIGQSWSTFMQGAKVNIKKRTYYLFTIKRTDPAFLIDRNLFITPTKLAIIDF